MPSSATITSFYSFAPNTKARASQVNTNFSAIRGHVIPIDPNTATAIHNTYDLGSTEYYWRTGYFDTINLRTSTSTSDMTIAADTSVTTGSMIFSAENSVGVFLFKNGGVTRAKIDESGLDGNYLKTNSVTIGSLFTRGSGATTTSSNGGMVVSPTFSVNNVGNAGSGTSTTYNISGSTISLTSIGRPVMLQLIGNYFQINSAFTISSSVNGRINLLKDGVTIGTSSFGWQNATGAVDMIRVPLNISAINYATAGAHNYSAQLFLESTISTYTINNAQLFAYELA